MSILNSIKVGAVCFTVGAAIGGGYAAYRQILKDRAVVKDTLKASQDFDAEIEASLRKTGGEEMVMQYRFEVARRTGKI